MKLQRLLHQRLKQEKKTTQNRLKMPSEIFENVPTTRIGAEYNLTKQ